jgi:TDG/mug DNA glycosylase family protein
VADDATVAVYEAVAGEYRRRRKAYDPERCARFVGAIDDGAVVLDLGCGPGLYLGLLPRPLVASDVAMAMCQEARATDASVPVVRHDLEALPFRGRALGGVWAWKCLQHVPAVRLPRALAELHRAMPVGGRLALAVFRHEDGGVFEQVSPKDDDFPGRLFCWWEPELLADLLHGAGFAIEDLTVTDRTIKVEAARVRTLPDVVGPGMRLLVCGLNPSLYAADAGVGYARPGNRFWPGALAAGIVSADRDPWHALEHHGVGFTDLVKRPSVGADELTASEYREGLGRLDRLCALLRPGAVAFCGLAGWRAAVDRKAVTGWQARAVGGARAYVLPNPSGLNAHAKPADIAAHLAAAYAGARSPDRSAPSWRGP